MTAAKFPPEWTSGCAFILWRDFAAEDETGSHFGVYDSEYSFFLALPESMHGSVLLRTNRDGSGWMVCNREGTTVYCELRLTDPAKETQTPDIDGEQTEAGGVPPHCQHWQPAAAGPRGDPVLWSEY